MQINALGRSTALSSVRADENPEVTSRLAAVSTESATCWAADRGLFDAGQPQPTLHRVSRPGDDANSAMSALEEKPRRVAAGAALVRDDAGQASIRVNAVDQDRRDRCHHLHRGIADQIGCHDQQGIHLTIMECRQRPTLMIMIVGGIHEDQQIARGRRALQRRMQHAHREAAVAGPGQYPDGAAYAGCAG